MELSCSAACNSSTATADPFAVVRPIIEERDALALYVREQAVEIVELRNRLEGRIDEPSI